jgi:hypothetical protein
VNEQDERAVIEVMRTLAKQVRTFYEALVEQKFKAHEAFSITLTWLDASSRRPPENKS